MLGRYLRDDDAVLVTTILDDDEMLTPTCAQRACEVRGIIACKTHGAVAHSSTVNKEARHVAHDRAHTCGVSEQALRLRAADGAVLSAAIEGGSGPLLLLIPGLGATRRVFDPLAPALQRRHRVITYDPRGVGDSERGTLPISMPVLAADAAAVIDAAGEGRVDVFGASMGGVVAQQLAVDHHDVVRRLILAATQSPGSHAVPANPAVRAALLGRGARTPEEAYRIACTVLYSRAFQRAHPEFIDDQVHVRSQHPVPPRVFREQLAAIEEASSLWDQLPLIAAPALVMHGTADAVAPFENAVLLADRIAGASLRPFDGSGHLFFHERPDESARVVSEFVGA